MKIVTTKHVQNTTIQQAHERARSETCEYRSLNFGKGARPCGACGVAGVPVVPPSADR
jgi:hypothetical protein